MDAWLHLVQRVAERYMAPPYNVRYFQVWNELKGYYNPGTNAYDYNSNPGNPNASTATNGYTYMYNQVYNRLMQVANELHIPDNSIKVGGPYVVMDTWASPNQSHLSNISKAYGIYDERSLTWCSTGFNIKLVRDLLHWIVEMANEDNVNNADPFTASERFADITNGSAPSIQRSIPVPRHCQSGSLNGTQHHMGIRLIIIIITQLKLMR